jgi:hypothetical protein
MIWPLPHQIIHVHVYGKIYAPILFTLSANIILNFLLLLGISVTYIQFNPVNEKWVDVLSKLHVDDEWAEE